MADMQGPFRRTARVRDYPGRTGIPQPAVKEPEPGEEYVVLDGVEVTPDLLTDQALRYVDGQFGKRASLTPRFGGPPATSSWLVDQSGLDDAIARLNNVGTSLLDGQSRLPAGLLEVEMDQLRKAQMQSGGSPGWDVLLAADYSSESNDLVKDCIVEVVDRLADTTTPDFKVTAYRRNTNHGWPSFEKGDRDLVIQAISALPRTVEETVEVLDWMESRNDGGLTGPITVLFSRTGHTNKFLKVWDFTFEGPRVREEWRGISCRRRTVFGVTSALNIRLLQAYGRISGRLKKWNRNYHGHPTKILEKMLIQSKIGEGFSDDLSGFDNTISYSYKEVLATHLTQRELMTPEERDTFLAIESSSVIAGGTTTETAARLYSKRDGLNSGNLLTSLVGNLINTARLLAVVSILQDVSPGAAWEQLGSTWEYLIWGDDTIVFGPSTWTEERWQEANDTVGFKSTRLPGTVFLMKYYDLENKVYFPLASRFAMQTIFREHAPRNVGVELFGIGARSDGLFDHPLGLETWANVIRGSKLEENFPEIGERDGLLELLESDWVLADIEAGQEDSEAVARAMATDLGRHPKILAALGRSLTNEYANLDEEIAKRDLEPGEYPTVEDCKVMISSIRPMEEENE